MRLEINIGGFATALRLLLVAGVCSLPAFPTVIVDYFTTGATSVGGNPVNAGVAFVIDTAVANTIDVYAWNFLTNIVTDASDISSVDFKLNNASPGTGMSIASRSGYAITSFNANGTYVLANSGTGQDPSQGYATVTNHWALQTNNGWFPGAYDLTTVGAGGKPVETIIGAPNSSNAYPNANNSITNNTPILQTLSSDPNAPQFSQAVHWKLTIPGVNASTVVTQAAFNFSTTAPNATAATGTTFPNGTPPPYTLTGVPEPSTFGLIGIGLIGFGARTVRRRQKA